LERKRAYSALNLGQTNIILIINFSLQLHLKTLIYYGGAALSIYFKNVKPEMFDECAGIIRDSFMTVATEFGLTKENAPTNPAFIEVDSLHKMYQRKIAMYGVTLNEEIIGFLALEKSDSGIYYMEKLAVLPLYRHKGFGKIIMDFAIGWVKDRGGKIISIGIIDENTILKNWYLGYGFVQTETKQYPPLPFTVCLMEKRVIN
jgi:ribosomal protein S18 acetylase RimI-like enzyme